MRTYKIVIIFISALLVGGTIGFFSTGVMTSGSINQHSSYTYDPSVPSPVESLKIQTDIGKINFQYNTSNLAHLATVDVDIKISGLFMEGKDYTAFFNPETEWWPLENEFYLKVLPDIWFDPSYWFKSYDITINVTLRTDITYDITAIVNVGSIEMTTANGVDLNILDMQTITGSINFVSKENTNFLGNFNLVTTTGSLTMVSLENSTFESAFDLSTVTGSLDLTACMSNFTQGMNLETITGSLNTLLTSCVLGDDLIGSVTTGSIELNMDDTAYTNDSELNLMTTTGSITLDIGHTNDIGANITSTIQTITGSINIIYNDEVANVGAQFGSSTTLGSINYVYLPAEFSRVSDVITSMNYNDPYINSYAFTCTVTTGSIDVAASSTV
ncbi:MAG: hypothetical protein KGD73_09945 [Candidatus Lokiarchaeota archaeon]|nr:hypothetical protein [Candidatus Lokiarchaeota archaeon]